MATFASRACAVSYSLRPLGYGVRSYVTLKDISMRLKAVKNIQKITKSMKMVAASKYAKAERELRPAKVFGQGAAALLHKSELISEESERKPSHLFICMTSDRGLCGGIHSSVAKTVRTLLQKRQGSGNTGLVLIGDKLRGILQRTHRKNIILGITEIGRKPPVFPEASFIAQQILNTGFEFDSAEIVFNTFKSVVSFNTTFQPYVPLQTLVDSEKMSIFDDVDSEILRCYHEMTLANLIYYGLKEGACSEQSARMTAMDAATKNSSEMIDKLTLTFNRTRQAVITRELIEIISGAAAL